jgi:hypothetical protein
MRRPRLHRQADADSERSRVWDDGRTPGTSGPGGGRRSPSG